MQNKTTSLERPSSVARPAGPKRRADSEATRERILDAAEKLFADAGFHATSVRDIAVLAGCQFALIGYHFGTKSDLLDHVVARRSSVLNQERSERLERLGILAKGKPIAVRALIEGFVGAIMDRAGQGDEGWSNYTRLIAAIAVSAEWSHLTDRHFNEVARRYVAQMKRSLPKVPDESLHQAFFFLIGAMVNVCARPDRVETLSQGRFGSKEVSRMTDSLYTFLEGGFAAVAQRGSATRPRKAATPARPARKVR
ncbi:MAG: TetR family transcriptional regulator [Pseudomonadota bacterium]